MVHHINDLNKIFNFITNNESLKAIEGIQYLNKKDLEYSQLGVTKFWHLFDWAVHNGQIDVASAIVARYAHVTEDDLLKPLAIDFYELDSNTIRFNLNSFHFLNFDLLNVYKFIVDEQKKIYIKLIQIEIKKLRILGIEKLLNLLTNPLQNKMLKALVLYTENSNYLNNVNQMISQSEELISREQKITLHYQKAMASINTANRLDDLCLSFSICSHFESYPLTRFKSEMIYVLNHPSNLIFKKSCNIGELLAYIGNIVLRYTGLGYVIAAAVGKKQEFNDNKWNLFSEKTKSLHLIEKIEFQVNANL